MSMYASAMSRIVSRTPIRQLNMPHQRVASHLLSIRLSQIDDFIAVGESESILRWLGCIPLVLVNHRS